MTPMAKAADPVAPAFSGTNVQEQGVDEPDTVKTDGRRIRHPHRRGAARHRPGHPPGHRRLDSASPGRRSCCWPATTHSFSARPTSARPTRPRRPVVRSPAPSPPPVGGRTELVLVDRPLTASDQPLPGDGQLVDARQDRSVARIVLSSTRRSTSRSGRPPPTAWHGRTRPPSTRRRSALAAGLGDHDRGGHDAGAARLRLRRSPGDAFRYGLLTVLSLDLSAPVLGDGDPIASSPKVTRSMPRRPACTSPMTRPPGRRKAGRRHSGRRSIASRSRPDPATRPMPLPARCPAHCSIRTRCPNGTVTCEWPPPRMTCRRSASCERRTAGSPGRGGLRAGGRRADLRRAVRRPARICGDLPADRSALQLDLTDPAHPRATGSLKITGYSAYLQPVDDDRLLGVGQEATAQGRPLGTQISLFDVSDPAAPGGCPGARSRAGLAGRVRSARRTLVACNPPAGRPDFHALRRAIGPPSTARRRSPGCHGRVARRGRGNRTTSRWVEATTVRRADRTRPAKTRPRRAPGTAAGAPPVGHVEQRDLVPRARPCAVASCPTPSSRSSFDRLQIGRIARDLQ